MFQTNLKKNPERLFLVAFTNLTLIGADEHLLLRTNSSIELSCLAEIEADKILHPKNDSEYCRPNFDEVLCWPRTKFDTTVVQPCFSEFHNVKYDVTNNATRYCSVTGQWDLSNYLNCHPISPMNRSCSEWDFSWDIRCSAYATSIIYYIGYTISLIALILAVIVFMNFKELRCLRNTIHINLFLTYILSIFLWILTLTLQMFLGNGSTVGCIFSAIFLHYFMLTNFFWMLVEGLYLYMLVVQTFSGDNIRFNLYFIIGYGFPSIFVGFWTIFKALQTESDNEIAASTPSETESRLVCSWMRESNIDWIIQGPACGVLIINLIFLIRIMWVLITKLRSANTVETRQYRKASKALLVLIPLLGITYLVVIAGPSTGVESHIFAILRAVLLSIQGFCVALFYCFFNSEVRQALKHRFHRLRDSRTLSASNSIRSRRYTMSKDYSPRSRTESIRLTTTLPLTS
ncbi:hypothetical protein PVAND_007386 [Polypedilum vanderplanki]|uniref:Diuretic hormone receptor n=1 Tax=Polypedilum vanderplanki TaxID=319348 RepID=A0A9J6C7N7_POLVA|nr:hypothetical protein PVAND_007386 [Polypedilum vanderplanki]